MATTIQEKRDRIVEEMSLFDDSYERFAYVIEKGKNAESLPDDYKIDAFRIEGCMSNLWLVPEFKDGLCIYRSDSDSPITHGVAHLLCELYSDHTPDDVLKLSWYTEFLSIGERERLVCIFDDRNKVVSMWRSLGVTCIQVNYGDF